MYTWAGQSVVNSGKMATLKRNPYLPQLHATLSLGMTTSLSFHLRVLLCRRVSAAQGGARQGQLSCEMDTKVVSEDLSRPWAQAPPILYLSTEGRSQLFSARGWGGTVWEVGEVLNSSECSVSSLQILQLCVLSWAPGQRH